MNGLASCRAPGWAAAPFPVVLLVIALMPGEIRVTLEDRFYPPFTLGGSTIRATIDPLLKVIRGGRTVCTDIDA
jgi:hypothetical protein